VHPGDWLQLDMGQWQVTLASPGVNVQQDLKDLRSFTLKDGEGVLLEPIAIAQARLASG
jgi:hypothetical protein